MTFLSGKPRLVGGELHLDRAINSQRLNIEARYSSYEIRNLYNELFGKFNGSSRFARGNGSC